MRRFIQKMKQYMQDNRGLTLIELLVAVVILGLVSAPLLHSFLSSANTEVKARKMGEATMVAQNVMESIEANTFDDILPSDAASLTAIFGAATGNVNYYSFLDSAYSSLGTDRPTSNNYHIGVLGISSGGQNYNVMIDIDPAPYTDINKVLLSEYSAMDAVFQVPKNTEQKDRTITMDVIGVKNSAGDKAKTVAEITEIHITVAYKIDDTVTTFDTMKYAVTDGKMPYIYLMYYPNYNIVSEGGTTKIIAKEDVIVINNMQDLEFDLFLVKQRDESISSAYLATAELASKCQVEQHLTGTYSATNKIGAMIYSNANENLAKMIGYDGAAELTNIKYNFVCGSGDVTSVAGSFGDTETTLDTSYALVKEKQHDRVYEITVKVYSSDDTGFSGDVLCTMSGTKLK